MSLSHAIRQREEMIAEYKRILTFETNTLRIEEINKQITLCEEQIAELKVGKPLFGKPKPLTQTTTIIEPDPENPGEQKVTVIGAKKEEPVIEPVVAVVKDETPQPTKSKSARLENNLRAKIQAAKAAKKV